MVQFPLPPYTWFPRPNLSQISCAPLCTSPVLNTYTHTHNKGLERVSLGTGGIKPGQTRVSPKRLLEFAASFKSTRKQTRVVVCMPVRRLGVLIPALTHYRASYQLLRSCLSWDNVCCSARVLRIMGHPSFLKTQLHCDAYKKLAHLY